MAWRVIEHKSSSVSFDVYEQLLRRTCRLLPMDARVRFMAERGFADTKLMQYLEHDLGWHYRIRVKNDLWVLQPGKPPCQLKCFHLNLGDAILLQGVKITKSNPYGQVNLAERETCVNRRLPSNSTANAPGGNLRVVSGGSAISTTPQTIPLTRLPRFT